MSEVSEIRPTFVRRLKPTPIVDAECVEGYGAIFNAGLAHVDGAFHLFARGVRAGYQLNRGPGPRFLDYISDVLVFTSNDGREYEFQQVLAAGAPEDVFSIEDPRVQTVRNGGADHVLMTYTHLSDPDSGRPWQMGVHRLVYVDGRFELNRNSGRVIGPESTPDKDGVIFNLEDGRVGLIHRLHPNMQLALFDSLDALYAAGPEYWDAHLRELDIHTLVRPSPGALGVGAGAPPVLTDDGLLLFYHERDADSRYTMMVALLDAETGRVESALPEPILSPELPWERNGDVADVVFVQGAVPIDEDTIYLTYGAADYCVGAATVSKSDLLGALRAAA